MSQSERIFEYLSNGGTLTVAEALNKFGCYALSQRCTEMMRSGVPIERDMVRLENGKRIARYKMGGLAHG
mgnify:CR=1 FL=1